jgi:hypothetical protein
MSLRLAPLSLPAAPLEKNLDIVFTAPDNAFGCARTIDTRKDNE